MAVLRGFPFWLFLVIEPISLIAGIYTAWIDPGKFLAAQVPSASLASYLTPESLGGRIVAVQLGNLYGLMFLVAVGIVGTTSEPHIVRNYLAALALADIGHVVGTVLLLGLDRVLRDFPAGWNDMLWGNVGFPVFLFVCRLAYLAGAFGNSGGGSGVVAAKGKKA